MRIKTIISTVLIFALCLCCFSAGAESDSKHEKIIVSDSDMIRVKGLAYGALNDIFVDAKSYCDTLMNPPEYYIDPNEEETWMREVGDTVFELSLMYRLTNDAKYFSYAKGYVSKAIAYPSWGRGVYLNNDLACAHLLVGISVYYDWFYDELESAHRKSVRDALCERSSVMLNGAWWSGAYLQNHSWVAAASMAVTAAAIMRDDAVLADKLFMKSQSIYENIFGFLSDDGSYHEGYMYMAYGLEYMLLFVNVAKNVYNFDYSGNSFIKNSGEFLVNMILPRMKNGSVNDAIDFADAPKSGETEFISVIAELASINADKSLQYAAKYCSDNYGNKKKLWRLLMTYNPEIENDSGITYSCDKTFDDLGFVFSRTGWDADPTVFAFKCGTAQGTKAVGYSKANLGTGHIHPDQNHFLLFFNGRRIFSDDGYVKSYTANHNTLTVNGAGQYYEGSVHSDWKTSSAKYAVPKIAANDANDEYLYVVGDASQAYQKEFSVKTFNRYFLFIKPDVLVVMDEVALGDGSSAKRLQTNFFSEIEDYKMLDTGVVRFFDGVVNMDVISAGNASTRVEKIERTTNKAGYTTEKTAFVVTADDTKMLQATAFSLAPKWKEPRNVGLIFSDNLLQVKVDDGEMYGDSKVYKVDIGNRTVKCEKASRITLSLDYLANALCMNGRLPFGMYNDVSLKVTAPDGKVVYIGQTRAKDQEFSETILIDNFQSGCYNVEIYNPEFGDIIKRNIVAYTDITISEMSIETQGMDTVVSLKAKNNTVFQKNAVLFAARYDDSGMTDIAMYRISLDSGETNDNIQLRLRGAEHDANRIVRAFVFSDNLRPLVEQMEG